VRALGTTSGGPVRGRGGGAGDPVGPPPTWGAFVGSSLASVDGVGSVGSATALDGSEGTVRSDTLAADSGGEPSALGDTVVDAGSDGFEGSLDRYHAPMSNAASNVAPIR
jgi:hypothetical protein